MDNVKTNTTQDAAVRLMLKFPYWSELYYTMTVYEDRDCPTLSTDGRNMWVNPEFWKTLTLSLKISALAHEVGHKMLLHCSRRGARDPLLWNMAADFVVNGILSENGFELGKDWLYDDQYRGWAVEAVYSDLEAKAVKQPQPSQSNYGQQQPQGGGNGNGQAQKGESPQEGTEGEASGEEQGESSDGGGDGDSDAGDGASGGQGADGGDGNDSGEGDGGSAGGSAGQAQDQGSQGGGGGNSVTYSVPGVPESWKDKYRDIRDVEGSKETIDKYEKEVMEAVEKAIMTARAHGTAPAGMEGFDDLMKPSKEAWYNHLHRYMQSLSMSEYNWARVNRRHLVQHSLFTPDHYSESLEHVVFAIDCSGSVFDAASQANFAGHVNAILAEAKPKHTHVMYFDSRVTRHDELEYGALDFSIRPKGGGGTDFRPIFERIEGEGIVPEIVIFLTDCYGSFPEEPPPYPVLWASIIDPKHLGYYLPPFGECVHVDPAD